MQRQVEEQWDFVGRSKRKEIDYEEIERKEFVPLPFYCEFGCGGEMKDEENSNSYDNGYCAAQNNCMYVFHPRFFNHFLFVDLCLFQSIHNHFAINSIWTFNDFKSLYSIPFTCLNTYCFILLISYC